MQVLQNNSVFLLHKLKMMIMVGRALQILIFLVFIQFWCMIAASGFYLNGSRSDGVILCIERERQALLTFKQGLVDDYDILSSWKNEDCCKWWGVECDNKTSRVIRLDLIASSLKGTISSSLLELQHLRYMGLNGNDFNGSSIPKFIGSLSNLIYLDLSYANFGGTIPSQLGNLSNLQSLRLGGNNFGNAENLEWLSHISSLNYLDLSYLNLSKATDWVQVVTNLPHLTTLYLLSCELPNIIPKSHISFVNASTSLAAIDLSYNNLTSSVYHWLFNFSSSLVHLDLHRNLLKGSIPSAFGNMTSLLFLDLSWNQLEGEIPNAFRNMTSLSFLDLDSNQLEGEIPKSLGTLCGLQRLFLDYNNLSGKLIGFIDNLSYCRESSLCFLFLSHNQITGTIPESLGQLSMLEILHLSQNSLEGVISEAQFLNLSRLIILDLSFNSLALDFKADWVPPFQLQYISLSSCKLGPHFPKWLLSQNSFFHLDISRAGISGTVPKFWDLSPNLRHLSLSNNQINGTIANSSPRYNTDFYPKIDLSSNSLEGPIPPFLLNAASLNLSGNKFSGPITFLCSLKNGKLISLDLSNNLLSGELPDCWLHVKDLVLLNLASNNFSGKIPNSMGFLYSVESLQLRHNNFVRGLPLSLKNCTQLTYLDVAENKLSGKLPTWIGSSLSKLVILILRSNHFQGQMTSHLCHLAYIQVLDLSFNNISGGVPKCINAFTVMAQMGNARETVSHNYSIWYNNHTSDRQNYENIALLGWKRGVFEFRSTLGLVKLIDLSSNNLTGEIPTEITELVGLISLNLSRNYLTGQIPARIGKLTELDVLDLSRNEFYGEIPSSLSQIQRLAILDLSNNKLSGKIPTGTQLQGFSAFAYEGNFGLCGDPLPNKCNGEEVGQVPRVFEGSKYAREHEDKYGFYVSVVLGFVVGFWSVCATLVLNRSWRYAYFNFLKYAKDCVYIRAVVYKAKLQRAAIN